MIVALAGLPILLVILLLLTKLPGWVPPATGTLIAIWVGIGALDATFGEVFGAISDASLTMIKVLAIIAGGVSLARTLDYTGAQRVFADWLAAGGPSLAAALMMANGVVPFMESVTGFGVSILIGLPLTLALGFTPYRSTLIALMGIVIGPWGSMAPGTLLGADLAGQNLQEFGVATAVLNIPAVIISGMVTAFIAGRQHQVGAKSMLGYLATGAASGLGLALLVLGANLMIGTPVAGAVAAAIMTFIWLLVIRRGKILPGPGGSIVPYAVLVVGTILGQMLSGFVSEGWAHIISSPALYAFAGVAVALWQYKHKTPGLAANSAGLWVRTAIPTALYILFGVTMQAGHIAETLAGSLATLGAGYLFLMPFIGALGGYITASGTGTNAMFGPTQVAVGAQLGVDPQWSMALNNASGCWGTIASPARIELSYQIAHGPSLTGPGPVVTRLRMLSVTIPVLVVTGILWGAMAFFLLPGLAAL